MNDVWKEAMDWYRASDLQQSIRRVANAQLEQHWPKDQGISSSDTNSAIVSLYRQWLIAKAYNPSLELIVFLMETINEVMV